MTAGPANADCDTPPPPLWARAARRGAVVAAVNLVVGLVITLFDNTPMARNIVYSECIGIAAWAFINIGRLALPRAPERDWPEGWRLVALVVAGTMFGFVFGRAMGDLVFGGSPLDAYLHGRRSLGKDLAITAMVGGILSGFFYQRGRFEGQRAALARAERDAMLARLDALRAQLEPHMLFNTLANLRVLIDIDPARAQAMLDRLIAFLRATLQATRVESHTLAAEFERVADYLALMQVRMDSRLQVRMELPDDLRDHPVPPLLLQPLVENGIRHGLEPKVEGGRIELRAAREGRHLVLEVRDTGVGLMPHAAPAGRHYGTEHVRQRLATLYGEQAQFTLRDAGDGEGGTRARITLPLHTR